MYSAGRDIRGWEQAWADGEVPDRSPYGLELLSNFGFDVALLSADVVPQLARHVPSCRFGRGHAIMSKNKDFAISWDEENAVALRAIFKSEKLFSGIIWGTSSRAHRGLFDLKRYIHRSVLRRFDGLWVLSKAQLSTAGEWLGHGAPPISFVKFGIDTNYFAGAGRTVSSKPLVAMIGGDRDRDHALLARAALKLVESRPDLSVIAQLGSHSPSHARVEAIPFLSHRDLRELYRSASVVVVATTPNDHVSGMTVALESMATGRPLVITESEGMRDYIPQDLWNIALVPQGDLDALTERVLWILDNPKEGVELGWEGRRYVEQHHTSSIMAEQLARVIRGAD